MNNNLKNLISEKLSDTKSRILKERIEVKNRVKIIKQLNKNKSKDKLIDDVITEMFYLSSKGYKQNVISENVIDWFKNLLGFGDNTMIEPVMDTFKESFLGYLIKMLAPGSTNSFLANIIKVGLADIDMNDLDKITDCEFLSDLITKAIVEGTINKLKNSAGMTSGISNVLRNGLVDQLDNMDFAKNLKEGINNFICDAIVDKISLLKDKVADLRG